jgi:hypothetical protein
MNQSSGRYFCAPHVVRHASTLCIAAFLSISASASPVSILTSGNSSVSIDSGTQAGMNNWTVDGQNQLSQQWFWYRIGSSGPEASIDTISAPVLNLLSPSVLTATYMNSQFKVNVLYSLVGGAVGSGVSDVTEQISIQNLTGSSLSFHFFQYADFNLGGTPSNDSASATRAGRGYNGVDQTDGFCHISENVDTVVSQSANEVQVATDNSLLMSLNNTTPTMLNNYTSASGNIKWALEWDKNIAAGGTMIISKDMNISGVIPVNVPEPSLLSLFGVAVISHSIRRYRAGRTNQN